MDKEMDVGYHIIPVNLTHVFPGCLVEKLGQMTTNAELVQRECREMEYCAQVNKAISLVSFRYQMLTFNLISYLLFSNKCNVIFCSDRYQ